MAIEIEQYVTTEEDCVCFRPEGPTTSRECLRRLEQLAIYCRENGATRVLFDTTNSTIGVATGLDVFQFGSGLAHFWPAGIRLVILCKPSALDSARFAQTVAQNRGLSFGLFEDLENARAWLNRAGFVPQTTIPNAHSLDVFSDNS